MCLCFSSRAAHICQGRVRVRIVLHELAFNFVVYVLVDVFLHLEALLKISCRRLVRTCISVCVCVCECYCLIGVRAHIIFALSHVDTQTHRRRVSVEPLWAALSCNLARVVYVIRARRVLESYTSRPHVHRTTTIKPHTHTHTAERIETTSSYACSCNGSHR